MKIAFIVNNFPTLSETFILNQITGILDMGHDIEIFAESNLNEKKVHFDVKEYGLMERVQYFNIPTNRIKRLLKAIYLIIINLYKDPLKILKSLNIFKYRKWALSLELLYFAIPFLNKDFDIIHCHFGSNGNIGAYLKQIGVKGKLIIMFHGRDIRLGLEKGGDIYHQIFECGNSLLAISDYNYKNLIHFGADPQKIIFHPVGIDLDNKFHCRGQPTPVEHSGTIIILTVARLVEEKGIEYGIQAISKLLKRSPRLRLKYHIVGSGPFEEKLKRLAENLNLDEVVCFLGSMRQEEVIQEMRKAHIFLLSSIAEVLPVVLMEAQAMGLPIVATSVGSVPQAVINNKSGFLVPERNKDAIAQWLKYFIEHPKIRLEMGKVGRKFVEEHYDIRKLNQRLVKIYESLLSGKSFNRYI